MLYVMKLSGKEIKDFLEESYYMWTNRMKSPEDHLLWLKENVGQVPKTGLRSRILVLISIRLRELSTQWM